MILFGESKGHDVRRASLQEGSIGGKGGEPPPLEVVLETGEKEIVKADGSDREFRFFGRTLEVKYSGGVPVVKNLADDYNEINDADSDDDSSTAEVKTEAHNDDDDEVAEGATPNKKTAAVYKCHLCPTELSDRSAFIDHLKSAHIASKSKNGSSKPSTLRSKGPYEVIRQK